ncbi:3-methyl-2-oxobutanoate hydroxymethyltransferase [Caldalkalibacillus thermarum TA2.A1]|uniref:3-methyl-2-oxobutanoate hydroxymethyltransferase n=1 Tax=Caldalkalibacillus thermarum (strain TA2.A1) TaxID=986075 RepID=F5L8W3_CALTT|nr:3-methyl-2-oxobutanoate hydroxymethyltransferase [Caldalkalibacillus thermarum]EGL82245.1 3-methyl-2-oxobutanoate hydroxymethyltransferase [Caldalkalibacillus thermarum TA2.A1]QZT32740.1 3-methyl-2-oxobutanoate hydroxymethyltransferase [Caldalkalibacillus thermarum TA2.A1]
MNKTTAATLKRLKTEGRPITMVTAYDYPTAKLVDEAGVDVILVGDSLGMVVLGYDSTIPVTLEDMLHHTKAVARGAKQALVVSDLPFLTYHGSFDRTLDACRRLLQEGGAQAVKLEGGQEIAGCIERLTAAGVPVMGHLGLTPQSVYQLGGYKVQGKDEEAAKKIIADAKALEAAGVFAIVLECVPAALAKYISEQIQVPTIGIGAGADCDGQVLVFHDLVGFGSDIQPKFVKQYAQIGRAVVDAVRQYVEEVRQRRFPTDDHSYQADEAVVARLYGGKDDER